VAAVRVATALTAPLIGGRIMQIIELELEHDVFYCPMTGEQIVSENEYIGPSAATEFIITDAADEFEYATDEFKQIYDDARNKLEFPSMDEVFQAIIDSGKASTDILCFAITTSCGPMSMTVYFGIDMNYYAKIPKNNTDRILKEAVEDL
jgi:hypothetical protein